MSRKNKEKDNGMDKEVWNKLKQPLDLVSLLFIFLIFINFRDIPNRYALLGAAGLYLLYMILYKKIQLDLNAILVGITLFVYARLRGFQVSDVIMHAVLPLAFALFGKSLMTAERERNGHSCFILLPVTVFLIGYSGHGVLNGITYFVQGTIAEGVRSWADFWTGEILKGTQHSIYLLPLLSVAVPAFIYIKEYKILCSSILAGSLFFLYYAWDSLARTPIMIFFMLAAWELILFAYLNRNNKKLFGHIKNILFATAILGILILGLIIFNWNTISKIPFVANLSKDGGILNNVRFVAQRSVLVNLFKYPKGGMPIEGLKMAHNVWLDMALDTGILTFGMFTLYTVVSLVQLIRLLRSSVPDELKYVMSGIYFAFILYYSVEPALNANIQFLVPWIFNNGLIAGVVQNESIRS